MSVFFTQLVFQVVFAELSIYLDEKSIPFVLLLLLFYLLDQSNQKIFLFDYCFGIHESSISLPKIHKTTSKHRSESPAVRLSGSTHELCHFVLSLF
jgi:hypothetical protein